MVSLIDLKSEYYIVKTIYMKNFKLLITVIILIIPCILRAQSIDFKQSWMGNTYGGTSWVQDLIDYMEVGADGTVYAETGWDEGSGGQRKGTYKDGQILPNNSRTINFKQVTDKTGKTWSIHREGDVSTPFSDKSITCSDGRKITDVVNPMALAIAKNGMLMVGEYGPRQQILYYDISGSGTPTLDHKFGNEFGTNSGIPGVVAPLKLREITGVGEDDAGNIYVAHNSFFSGCKLQSYTPAGQLNWELNGLVFVDNGDFDPTTDGKDIYTKNHHFAMDYSKPAGLQWKDSAYTINRFKYPDDARLHPEAVGTAPTIHPSSAWIRYRDGKKILIVNDMYNDQLRMYRFNYETDGEIAIPSVLYAKNSLKPYLFNFKYFKLDNDSVNVLSYCEKRGTQNEPANVASIQGGNYLAYCDVNFGTGKTTFKASTACPAYGALIGGVIELHADSLNGRILGSVTTTATGDWSAYKTFTANLSDTITGLHKLYLRLKYPNPDRWPVTEPEFGQWLWTDINGDGQMNTNEYQTPGSEMKNSGGYWVDKNLNIWIFNNNILKVTCEGLDAFGNPKYTMSAVVTRATPAASVLEAQEKGAIEYDADNDIMYLLKGNLDGTGGFVAKYSNWSTGNDSADWKIAVVASQSMCIAGDYLFTINGKNCKVYAYSLANGKFAGKMDPTGPIGWIDIPYGIRAIKRSNGEYVVVTEEDSKGKLLLFRFSNFLPNTPPSVKISIPKDNQQIVSAKNIAVSASASDLDGEIAKVEIFLDDSLVSIINKYTIPNASIGKHTLYAKAFDAYGDSASSDTVHFSVIETGIKNITSNNILVYPNPASDKIYIKASGELSGLADICITDISGRTFIQEKYSFITDNVSELYLSGLQDGIYILKIRTSLNIYTVKLIVKKSSFML